MSSNSSIGYIILGTVFLGGIYALSKKKESAPVTPTTPVPVITPATPEVRMTLVNTNSTPRLITARQFYYWNPTFQQWVFINERIAEGQIGTSSHVRYDLEEQTGDSARYSIYWIAEVFWEYIDNTWRVDKDYYLLEEPE